jgi:hypothetical protein
MPRNRPHRNAIARTTAIAALLSASLSAAPAWALSPDVTEAMALYDAVMNDPARLPKTCANLRKLSELQRSGTVAIGVDAHDAGALDDAPVTSSDVDGWQGADHERKVSKLRQAGGGGGFLSKSALIASDPLMSVSAALYEKLVRGSDDDLAIRAAAARLFDKCTM